MELQTLIVANLLLNTAVLAFMALNFAKVDHYKIGFSKPKKKSVRKKKKK